MGKRGRKPSEDKKGYFYEEQENAVMKYISSENEAEKEKVFQELLYPAFTKMIESIIRRYNLYLPDEIFQETFDDTLSFLLTKIHFFNPSSGFKAYSYCGTICKNYLILKINQYNKNLIRNERYELVQSDVDDNIKYSYDEQGGYLQHLGELIRDTCKEIEKMLEESDKHKLNEKELKVGYALVQLLSNWDDLFVRMGSHKFNKSSILMFLKELTLLDTTEIRNAMKKYKNVYQDIRKKMLDDIYR